MTSVRKIDEQTEEKIVERTGVSIGGRTDERTVTWTVVKTEEKTDSSTAEKIAGKIGGWIVVRIAERTTDQMQVVSFVGLIEPTKWPVNMGVKGESTPA